MSQVSYAHLDQRVADLVERERGVEAIVLQEPDRVVSGASRVARSIE